MVLDRKFSQEYPVNVGVSQVSILGPTQCRLGDQYTGLGTQALVPKKHILSFLFSVVFHQRIG